MSPLIFAALAHAEPLVDAGSVQPAARAAAATGRPVTAFELVPVASLGEHPPVLMGPGRLLPCPSPAGGAAALRAALGRAAGALGYGEFDQAEAELRVADAIASCPGEPLLARDLADIDRGLGVLEVWRGRPEAARAWFNRAAALDPAAPAGEDWPAAAVPMWTAAASTPTAPATLAVLAPLPGVVLTVDGVPAAIGEPLSLHAGRHVAWLAGPVSVPLPLELHGGDVRVIVPAAFPDRDLEDPAARTEISARFEGVFGTGAPILVATERQVFRTTAGSSAWDEIHRVRPPPARAAGRIALGAGLAAVVGGAVPAILAYGDASDAAADMTGASSTPDWQSASARYQRARSTFGASVATGIGGAAISGIGLVLVLATPDPYR